MFYKTRVRNQLLIMFRTLDLDQHYRNKDLITNTIFDQGVRNIASEAKRMNMDPESGALYCIHQTLISMLHEINDKSMPEEMISRIDQEVFQRLADAMAAVGLSLEEPL